MKSFSLSPGEVWGFNAETGKLRWFARGTSDNSASSSLAIDGDVVCLPWVVEAVRPLRSKSVVKEM